MQQPKSEPGAVATGQNTTEPNPLDEAETRSENAWNDAGDAVTDLKKLGHEDDETETPE